MPLCVVHSVRYRGFVTFNSAFLSPVLLGIATTSKPMIVPGNQNAGLKWCSGQDLNLHDPAVARFTDGWFSHSPTAT